MNNKIIVGTLMILSLLTPSVYAKEKAAPPPKPLSADDMVAKMKLQLELTDQQAEQVKPIIANYLAEEIKINLEEKKQLRKVLTDQQMYTWIFLQNEKPHESGKKKHSSLF